MHHRFCLVPLIALAACGTPTPLTLTVIAPDGGDPFLGPDAATVALISFDDNGATAPVSMRVDAMGGFMLNISPATSTEVSRLIIQAARGSDIVGTGATPPTVWSGVQGHAAAILMHRRDSLVPAPSSFATGRAEFRLLPFSDGDVAAITVPQGSTEAPVVEYYDLLAHVVGRELQAVPATFDEDTAVVTAASEWILINGVSVVAYTNDPMLPVNTTVAPAPSGAPGWPFTQPSGSTEVDDPTDPSGGGWLVGGHDASGAPSNIVDHLQVNADLTAGWTAPPTMLATPRLRPDVIVLTEATSTSAPLWLVVGGQASASAANVLEIYSPSGVPAVQPSLAAVTPRTDTAAVCVAFDNTGCTAALVLGGRDAMGHPVTDDLLVDGVRARAGDAGCVSVLSAPLFAHRRFGARAALAEGAHVLIAGGHDASSATDAVYDAESIDVTMPLAPQAGRIVATLTNADPAVIGVSNGSVMLAGGRRVDGSAGTEVWFYRY